jgi:integrase
VKSTTWAANWSLQANPPGALEHGINGLEPFSHAELVTLADLTSSGAAPMPNRKYLTREETDRLFRAIHSVRDQAIFRVAYHRGLRAREVGLSQLANNRGGGASRSRGRNTRSGRPLN